jgi:hypothetical protein
MLKAKADGRNVWPILHHAAIHATLCAIVMAFAAGPIVAFKAFVVQCLTHWAIDITKGRINAMGGDIANPTKYSFWMLFGADQFAHTVVLLYIASMG